MVASEVGSEFQAIIFQQSAWILIIQSPCTLLLKKSLKSLLDNVSNIIQQTLTKLFCRCVSLSKDK